MTIKEKQKLWLKKQVHHLKPVVSLGRGGLTEAVLSEIEVALDHHELIKIKLAGGGRVERIAMITAIAEQAEAELILSIGQMAVFYRPNPQKKDRRIALPSRG